MKTPASKPHLQFMYGGWYVSVEQLDKFVSFGYSLDIAWQRYLEYTT